MLKLRLSTKEILASVPRAGVWLLWMVSGEAWVGRLQGRKEMQTKVGGGRVDHSGSKGEPDPCSQHIGL